MSTGKYKPISRFVVPSAHVRRHPFFFRWKQKHVVFKDKPLYTILPSYHDIAWKITLPPFLEHIVYLCEVSKWCYSEYHSINEVKCVDRMGDNMVSYYAILCFTYSIILSPLGHISGTADRILMILGLFFFK